MSDVCLILEGTYPYAVGGVSTWVHSLITGLPEIEFALIHIQAGGKEREPKFELPPNLQEVMEIAITSRGFEICGRLYPQAAIYHALSSGFAGLLGIKFKRILKRPLILTEHGICWREAELGAGETECGFKVDRNWAVRFREMAKLVYREADAIITVCEANRRLQLVAGAPAERCRIIPNGVGILASEPREAPDGRPCIGLVGRVVPLKDVATFIAACRILADELPEAEFFVVGPTDQDEGYYRECLELRRRLGLNGKLHFTGEVDPLPYYRMLDVMVLTSISEGQPLAILEAMAAGVPVVATDVGGCAETLGVSDTEAAGLITPPSDPQATAEAVLKICRNRELYARMSTAGLRRAKYLYHKEYFLAAYRALYETIGAHG